MPFDIGTSNHSNFYLRNPIYYPPFQYGTGTRVKLVDRLQQQHHYNDFHFQIPRITLDRITLDMLSRAWDDPEILPRSDMDEIYLRCPDLT
jgi:hypothetical protein